MFELTDKQKEIIEAAMADGIYIKSYYDLMRNGIVDKLKEAGEPYVSEATVNIYISDVRLSKDYNMGTLCDEEKAKVRETEEYLFSKMWEASELETISHHILLNAIIMRDETMKSLAQMVLHFARIIREKFIRMSSKSNYPGSEKEYRRALALSKKFFGK